MRARPVLVGALLVLLSPLSAHAGDNDFRLNATRGGEGVLFTEQGGRFVPLDDFFDAFATELGYVLAPRLASPAETLGHSGFHVSGLWSGTFVSSDERFWGVTERGQRGGANRVLQTLQMEIRKGLPFSFEVGASFLWLIDSELFAPALEARWAVQEGYRYLPDLGIRGSASHMIGNRDLLLTTIGLDAVLSKGFGLFGMVHVTPYVSWSFLLIAASSRVIDPTPLVEEDLANNIVFAEKTATSDLDHKLTIGVRTLYYVLNVSAQGEFQMLEGGLFGPVATITTKLGLDF